MDAIARCGGDPRQSGPRAEALLNEMMALYETAPAENNDLKPTRRSFNAVILAYRQHGDGGQKAEEILKRMEDLADSGENMFDAPDVVSYNCAMAAIVNGEHTEAADRAQALLDRMASRQIKADGRTYSHVIEAWLKRNDDKGHALAEQMLQQFLDQVKEHKMNEDGGQNTEKKNNKTKKKKPYLYEDAVWDVINAYRKDGGESTENDETNDNLDLDGNSFSITLGEL